jgi:phosphoglycolate phosphatase-like HAD superfamily hydrolase
MVAMRRAFFDLHGVDDAFGRVEFSGRTDTALFRDAAIASGMEERRIAAELPRFFDAYVGHLEPALREKTGRLMPGIADVLHALDARDDVVQGLGTGNLRRGGEIKLRHFGIDRYFPGCTGGFGEDSHDRNEVIRIGIGRLCDGARPDRVVIIGDTPHDVTAARANGAFALAVATGRDSVQDLVNSGADAAVQDLSDLERALQLIIGDPGVR